MPRIVPGEGVEVAEPQYDAMVAKVQQWLVDTYGSKVSLTVNGRTGWSTMYALTRALQHELGITALSSNFGTGTLGALSTQHPRIGAGTKATNIVKIVQGGLYCKGYNPNGLDGIYGNGCTTAVSSMQRDMGVTADGVVTPKVFKGLLTMDAYVLLSGGSSAARTVQQWLNSAYLDRANFFIMPCDGMYSRNTQKALVYALQFEMGMSDAVATGSIGDATRSGLSAQAGFSVGTTDLSRNWVKLFHAAMIFNKFPIAFDPTYSSADAEQVKAFQEFCKLDVTGAADYRTWCSLLVSNGDPSRPGTACDTRVQITPAFAAWLVGKGYRTVGRYLTNARVATPLDKEIKPGELATIHGAGLSVFPIYQEVGSEAKYFTYASGYEAAYRADAAARRHGIPSGTTIYFAVDFDPTDDQIAAAVTPYFQGVKAAMAAYGSRYGVGSYGTRNVCQTLYEAGLAKLSFVAGMSTGFSGNLGYTLPKNWAFDQIFESEPLSGLPLDKDIASGRDAGFSTTVAPTNGANGTLHGYLLWLEALAHEFSAANLVAAWESPAVLVCQMVRHREYGGFAFTASMGSMNKDWIAYAMAREAAAGYTGVPTYYDPMMGPTVTPWEPAHLFVALEAYLRKGVDKHKDSPFAQDLLGWAGDLLSVMNAYQVLKDAGSSMPVEDFVHSTMLAMGPVPGLAVNFGLPDACQDADAYNIALEYTTDPGASFADLAMRHINTGGPSSSRNRFRAFVEDRFKTESYFSYAARQALAATEIQPDPHFITEATALLALASSGSTSIYQFTVPERRSIADGFSQKVIARM